MTAREASASGCARYKLKCDLGPKNKGFRNLVSHDAEAGRGDDGLRLLTNPAFVSAELHAERGPRAAGLLAEATALLPDLQRESVQTNLVASVTRFVAVRGAQGGKPTERLPMQRPTR